MQESVIQSLPKVQPIFFSKEHKLSKSHEAIEHATEHAKWYLKNWGKLCHRSICRSFDQTEGKKRPLPVVYHCSL